MEAAAAGIPRQVGRTAQYHCIKSLHIEEVEETLALSRYSALVIKSSGLSVVDPCRSCQPFRTESARHRARMDGDWYVTACRTKAMLVRMAVHRSTAVNVRTSTARPWRLVAICTSCLSSGCF
jgi:hypothetical protein